MTNEAQLCALCSKAVVKLDLNNKFLQCLKSSTLKIVCASDSCIDFTPISYLPKIPQKNVVFDFVGCDRRTNY